MKVLYLKGSIPEADAAVARQVTAADPDLEISVAPTSADALVEIRKGAGLQAVLISPSVSQPETLALIASLRHERAPVAIVPVVDESHKDVFAAAVAAGADDVLVTRGHTLLNLHETLARIRQSPHLFPTDARRRLRVLYAGRDALVWNLIEQVPFVKAERVTCGVDGACPIRAHGATDGSWRCDVVVIDELPGDAHPLQVLKSVKGQASDLPVVMLTSTAGSDVATAALELGADDTVLKTGIFRRRLIATLRRVHQRLELQLHHGETEAREERLRQIVENVPCSIAVVGGDGAVLAMNAEGLRLFGASRPREVVGRDFRSLVADDGREAATEWLRAAGKGDAGSFMFFAESLSGVRIRLVARAAVLERDARGGRGVIVTFNDAVPPPVAMAPGEGDPTDSGLSDPDSTDERDEARDRLVADLEQERARCHQLQDELDEARRQAAELTTLTARLTDAETLAGVADQARLAANAELRVALETAEEERASRHAAEQALAATTAQLSLSHSRTAELEHAADAARAGLVDASQYEQALEASRRERTEAEASLQALRDELEQTRAALEHAQRTAADSAAERTALEAEFDILRASFADEREEWERQREAAAEAERTLSERLAIAEQELAALGTALDAARSELHHTDEARAADRAEWTVARTALEAETVELAAQIALRDQTIAQRDARLAELAAESAALGDDRSARDAAWAALNDAQSRFDAERGDLEAAQAAIERDRASFDAERMTFDAQRSALDAQRVALDADRVAFATERSEQVRVASEAAEEDLQHLRDANAALEAENQTLARALADERDSRDRDQRELDALRATFEKEEALRADMDARMAQSNRDASARFQTREAELISRCDRLEAALAESERRRRDADHQAELAVQAALASAAAATPSDADPALEETGALAHAMVPDLESLVTTLRDALQRVRSQLGGHRGELPDLDRHGEVLAELAILVRQLGAFSRRHIEATATVELTEAITHAEPMLAHLVGSYVGFEVRTGAPTSVSAPQADFDQLFSSLVTFGRDVLPAGGTVILETGPGPRLSVSAMGYGVRAPLEAPAIALVARRCGGTLTMTNQAGWKTCLDVTFAPAPAGGRREWTWADGKQDAGRTTSDVRSTK